MVKILVSVLMSAAMLVGTAGVALADPDLPDIQRHRHYIVTATGDQQEVGPRVCVNPALQDAFNQFHSNIHHAVAGSPGPSESAPGLHNDTGAELTAVGGCPQ